MAATVIYGRPLTVSELQLDACRREVTVRGRKVSLTGHEFDLVYQLAAWPSIVCSRASLLQKVWNDDGLLDEHTVDTVISRLRRKIEAAPRRPELILTAWGVGYKFAG